VQGSLKYVCRILDREFDSQGIFGLADLRLESSFVGFLKPRPKLTFGYGGIKYKMNVGWVEA